MMKRLIVLSVVMLAVLATAASATLDTAWLIQLRASDSAGGSAGSAATYGCGTLTPATGATGDTIVWIGLTGTSPPQIRECDASLPANQVMTWDMTVQAGSLYNQGSFKLAAWNLTSATADLNQDTSGPDAFTVKLYKGDTELFEFLPSENGTSTAPQYTVSYAIAAGGTMEFLLKREPIIPEPGSIVALMSGLVGLVGFGIRRRR